ncbi:hypothetical protein JCM10207_000328 [Rhodosporidiobolus poonsookiae]
MAAELATLLPVLFPDEDHSLTLDALRSFGISSASQLAFYGPATPPHPSLHPTTFTRLQCAVSAHLAAPSSSGTYLLKQHLTHKGKQPLRYTTSLDELDDHLAGGFELGDVVELCGTRQSGRTALALYATLLHLLLHADNRAAWLDTAGAFDPYRCLAILRDVLIPRLWALGGTFAATEGAPEPGAEELAISVLDRLAVTRVGKAGDALDTLAVETKAEGRAEKLDWVVIDSLDALLGGDALAGNSAQGHATLVAFMRRLSSLAHSSTLPLVVLVITTAVPSASAPRAQAPSTTSAQPPPLSSLPLPAPLKPALGTTFSYLTGVSLLVLPAEPLFGVRDGRGKYLVEVERNPRGKTGAVVAFAMIDGIKLEQLDE